MCQESNCQFTDNNSNFKFRDGSCDDSLLDHDKVHMSRKGLEKVIKNLKLDGKIQPKKSKAKENRTYAHVARSRNTQPDTGIRRNPVPQPHGTDYSY